MKDIMTGQEKCDLLIMDVSTIHERLERTRESTQQAILGTQELMRQTRLLVEQSEASCRESRALIEALEERASLTKAIGESQIKALPFRIAAELTNGRGSIAKQNAWFRQRRHFGPISSFLGVQYAAAKRRP